MIMYARGYWRNWDEVECKICKKNLYKKYAKKRQIREQTFYFCNDCYLIYKKKGISTNQTFTRSYIKRLVKDYGYIAIRRNLQKKYNVTFLDDCPLRITTGRDLGTIHKIKIHISFSLKRPFQIEAFYDIMDRKWYFLDKEKDEWVDINQFLKFYTREK